MTQFSNDPRWIVTKFASKDANGNLVKKGERAFYYPLTKALLTGEEAEAASREFEAARLAEEGY
jgi:hypothetical protein